MYSTIHSGALLGMSAYLVMVEVDIDRGLPAFFKATITLSLDSLTSPLREPTMQNAGNPLSISTSTITR